MYFVQKQVNKIEDLLRMTDSTIFSKFHPKLRRNNKLYIKLCLTVLNIFYFLKNFYYYLFFQNSDVKPLKLWKPSILTLIRRAQNRLWYFEPCNILCLLEILFYSILCNVHSKNVLMGSTVFTFLCCPSWELSHIATGDYSLWLDDSRTLHLLFDG